MIIRTVFRAVGWLVSELTPMQAIRTIRGCDYTQAVTRAEAVLRDLEEERETLEPDHFQCIACSATYGRSGEHECPTLAHYGVSAGPSGAEGVRIEPGPHALNALRGYSPRSAAQAAESPAGVDDPPGVPPAGHLQHPR